MNRRYGRYEYDGLEEWLRPAMRVDVEDAVQRMRKAQHVNLRRVEALLTKLEDIPLVVLRAYEEARLRYLPSSLRRCSYPHHPTEGDRPWPHCIM